MNRFVPHIRRGLVLLTLGVLSLLMTACFSPQNGEVLPPPAHIHDVVRHSAKEPTCTSVGWYAYRTCRTCDDYSTYFELPMTGHTLEAPTRVDQDSHASVCTVCGESTAEAHTYVATGTGRAPTCKDAGADDFLCTVCNAIDSREIPATGVHELSWEAVGTVNAFTEVTEAYRCTVCGTEEGDRRTAPAPISTMPIIYLTGDYGAATRDNDVTVGVRYVAPGGEELFSCTGTIHVQGATSSAYAKKNYTLKLYTDTTLSKKNKVDLGWGKESKYCLKANWVDCSQARNIVSCRLWADMVALRDPSDLQRRLNSLKTNAGAIDGYPICVYMNGQFHGLYTMNVPKDNWMFDMGDSETEAILMAGAWIGCDFTTTLGDFTCNSTGDWTSGNWEIEYFGTEETTGDTSWVKNSFNRLIQFVRDTSDKDFVAGIDQYMDVDSAIDYMLMMYLNHMTDNCAKNMLWATYDGVKWFPSVYDQDGVFGMRWDGIRPAKPSASLPSVKTNGTVSVGADGGSVNILFGRLWKNYTERIIDRYRFLRQTVFSEEHILGEFDAFFATCPDAIFEADFQKWYSERYSWSVSKHNSNNIAWNGDFMEFGPEYIAAWVKEHLIEMDKAFNEIAYEILGEERLEEPDE